MADDVHTLTGVYALDALSADERAEFESHLEECPACRREVREFRAVCADLALLAEQAPPPSLRSKVLEVGAGTGAAETIQWATRELLAARTRQDVVDTVLTAVDRLGGWVVPADLADERAVPLDVAFGSGAPLLPAAEVGSRARQDLERHLPQLVEDARQALETIRRTQDRAERRAGSEESDGRRR